jgi:hypothetical protein
MKANPGGTVTGDAILGRDTETNGNWNILEKRSVILTAERRVGKTCVLRKMQENPKNEWIPLLCFVEDARHPIDCVEKIFREAERNEAQSTKGRWLTRVRTVYGKLAASTEIGGWKLPTIQADWKQLLNSLIEDVAENTGNKMLVMLDEFPMMIANIIDTPKPGDGASVAMEFLDALRAIRQRFEPSNQVRFLFSGSIGLHLILEDLKANHGYKGNPTNDMTVIALGGMRREDVRLMCTKYLDEEGIDRPDAVAFEDQMFRRTDGLPLYVQYVCERFQDARKEEVRPIDIDETVRRMMDSREVEWFSNAADRIDGYYAKLKRDRLASTVLKHLSHTTDYVAEKDIVDHLRAQMTVERDEIVVDTLDLLYQDNYLVRDTSSGGRRYRFRYELMRWWWEINRG